MNTPSARIGNFLFRHAFPVYNAVYPVFKRRQDKREISIMTQYLKAGDYVLDIGANIGFYTRILSRLVGPHGRVYSFEPDTVNFRHLQKNCGKLANVVLHNKAVGAETGTIRIYTSPMLNVDHRTYPVDDYQSMEEIPCVSPDGLFPRNQRVDFIKIDIQGFEVSAFRGMVRLLAQNPGIRILSEFWPHGLSKAGETAADFLQIFWDAGLQVYFVADSGFELITPENLPLYDHPDPSAYMNIFVTRNK